MLLAGSPLLAGAVLIGGTDDNPVQTAGDLLAQQAEPEEGDDEAAGGGAKAGANKRNSSGGRKRPQVLYPAHLPLSEIMAGIRAGTLKQGVYHTGPGPTPAPATLHTAPQQRSLCCPWRGTEQCM